MFLTIALVCSLLTPMADGDAPAWEWKKPEGQEQYDQAKKQYEEGSYQAAGKAFSALRKLAKDKATKHEVNRYRTACEGGIKLAVYRAKAKKGAAYKAYLDAEKASAKYEDTPIAREYLSFLNEMRDEIYTVVETFDRTSSRYSEDKGKFFETDPDWVKQGSQSLRWEVKGENISLKVKRRRLPEDFTQYKAISMWICFPKKGAPYSFAFRCKGESKQETALFSNAFVKSMKAHTGWQRVEVPFDKFRQQGKASWNEIKDFRIEFNGAPNVVMYIDDINMIKK